jgi:hypothetical protein
MFLLFMTPPTIAIRRYRARRLELDQGRGGHARADTPAEKDL